MLTLRRQEKLLTDYKRALVSTIKRVNAKTEFVVRERSQELYEFLLKNNEQTQGYINQYRADQEAKVQQTVQYYGAFIGPDLKDIQLPGTEEKSEVKLTNLLKVINLRTTPSARNLKIQVSPITFHLLGASTLIALNV